MQFEIDQSIEILSRTPDTLSTMLGGLSDDWLKSNEGENTWSPYDVVGHLIHGELTDWIPRARIILSDHEDKSFVPFDRFAQMHTNIERSISDLLQEFKELRVKNLEELKKMKITNTNLSKQGIHPEFGTVNLRQLLSTWVVHDLGHIAQISRVMAKQYEPEVGPWSAYLGILKK